MSDLTRMRRWSDWWDEHSRLRYAVWLIGFTVGVFILMQWAGIGA